MQRVFYFFILTLFFSSVSLCQQPQLLTRWHYGPVTALAAGDTFIYSNLGGVFTVNRLEEERIIKISELIIDDIFYEFKVNDDFVFAGAEKGVYIINVSDKINPVLASFIQLPSSAETIFIKGNFLYSGTYNAGLFIYDISDPYHPAAAGNITITDYIKDIFVTDSVAFIAADSLIIADVKNPASPSVINIYKFNEGLLPQHLYSEDSLLYITTSPGDPYDNGTFTILNISDIKNLTVKKQFELFGDWTSSGGDIAAEGNNIYFVNYSDAGEYFCVYNTGNPDDMTRYDLNMTLFDIEVSGGKIFADNNDGDLVLLRQAGSQLTQVTKYAGYGNPNTISGKDNFLFVSTSKDLLLFELTGDKLKLVNSIPGGGAFYYKDTILAVCIDGYRLALYGIGRLPGLTFLGDTLQVFNPQIYIRDNYCFTVDRYYGLQTFNITDPFNPVPAWKIPDPDLFNYGIFAFKDSYCYVTNAVKGLVVFNISDPQNVSFVRELSTGSISRMTADNYFLYTSGSEGIRMYNIFNPADPVPAGSYTDSVYHFIFNTKDSYIYSSTRNSIEVLNAADPANIYKVSSFNPSIFINNVFIDDKYLFLSSYDLGFSIYTNSLSLDVDREGDNRKPAFKLSQNYPNPFNPVTEINYSVPVQGVVQLNLYDVLGRKISTLVNEYKPAGEHLYKYDGSALPSGIYIYELTSGSYRQSRKMVLLK